MISGKWQQNFLVDCSVKHARDGRADDQVESNVEEIKGGTPDRADNFLSEAFFGVRFIVPMNDLFGGKNQKNDDFFALHSGIGENKNLIFHMLGARARKSRSFSQVGQ